MGGKTRSFDRYLWVPPRKRRHLWEEAVKRYCKHSQLHYAGMLVERHMGYQSVFMDPQKTERARAFAQSLWTDWVGASGTR